jgi:O-6-methylguanine DNA methyltransferase
MTFREKVFEVVRKIPKGKTLTYKQVAALTGSPNAYRAVGTALKSNYNTKIPCHRVIKSNGEIGEYNRGKNTKIKILRKEGAI